MPRMTSSLDAEESPDAQDLWQIRPKPRPADPRVKVIIAGGLLLAVGYMTVWMIYPPARQVRERVADLLRFIVLLSNVAFVLLVVIIVVSIIAVLLRAMIKKILRPHSSKTVRPQSSFRVHRRAFVWPPGRLPGSSDRRAALWWGTWVLLGAALSMSVSDMVPSDFASEVDVAIWVTPVLYGLAVLASLPALVRGKPWLAITPSGVIVASTYKGTLWVPWEAMAPDWIIPPLGAWIIRPELVEVRGLIKSCPRRLPLGRVDAANDILVTDTIALYLAHPQLREFIGTADELPRLQSRINDWYATSTPKPQPAP